MTDFFDWLTATDSGAAAERLAAQFKISPKEMRETTDALVPAFMLGFQRTMADPAAWTRLMSSFGAAGGSAKASASLPSQEAGDAVMRAFFGPELMQAVARQASLLTGQAPDTIVKMMPALGALTFQSMLQMMAAAASNPQAYPTDPGGHVLAEAMRRSANAMEAFSRPSNAGPKGPSIPVMTDIFADALKGSFPWMPTPIAAASTPTDPFAFFSRMMDAFSNQAPSGNEAQAEAKDQRAARQAHDREPLASVPGLPGMMANAHSLQADYVREMMSLFERHRGS